MLVSYACDPANSRGRLYSESPTPYRNEFERDRDRLIHSNAFRRLEYKTQVFVNHEGDHYRNRLTHSIEVASVARSVAKMLCLSDDLAEIVALAHDLGHSPFGHAGEEALNECVSHYQKFCHNAHSLKIITKLECRYARYNGLNLTWEVLEGIVKHNGPLTHNIADYIIEYNMLNDLELTTYPSAEAQIASLADDIAYICHDLEDSVRAGIVIFSDIAELEIIDQYVAAIKKDFPELSYSRTIYEATRKLIHYLIKDLLDNTKDNINSSKVRDCYDIRHLNKQLVNFSPTVIELIKNIKEFLFAKLYRHSKVQVMNNRCKKIVKSLFDLYSNNLNLLPNDWQEFVVIGDEKKNRLLVADYIAGMTDRFAINQYEKHYAINFNSL